MDEMEELRDREFETARGRKVKFSSMEHGHLCNIIHYGTYINTNNPEIFKDIAQKEIDRRFGGEMLPYEPKYAFEVSTLQEKGMLKPNISGEFDIIENGNKIGIVKKMAILSNL